jgi:hypothetical protein
MAVIWAWQGDVAGAARRLGQGCAALRRRIEREALKSRTREVSFDGIRAVRKGRGPWLVSLSAVWVAGGVEWTPLEDFAAQHGLSPNALREGLRESAKRNRDGEASFAGLRARKLGVRWLICFPAVLP